MNKIKLSNGSILICNELFSSELVYEVKRMYNLTKVQTDDLYWKWYCRDYIKLKQLKIL